MPLSRRTLAKLSSAIARDLSHAEITELAFEHGLVAGGYTKRDRAVAILGEVEKNGDLEAAQDLYRAILISYLERQGERYDPASDLGAALRLDGYTWQDGRLLAAEPTGLAGELSALERRLADQGLEVALRHYQQALDSVAAQSYEASNGQVRSFLEDLIPSLAARGGSRPR